MFLRKVKQDIFRITLKMIECVTKNILSNAFQVLIYVNFRALKFMLVFPGKMKAIKHKYQSLFST